MLRKPPSTRRNLDVAIMGMAGSETEAVKLRTTMANVVAAQMMPEGAFKGGSSLRMRFGEAATRFTTDFDTARSIELDAFISRFSDNLSKGWNGFTGRIVKRPPASPEGVPARYVLQPFDIKLDYRGRPSVPLRQGAAWSMDHRFLGARLISRQRTHIVRVRRRRPFFPGSLFRIEIQTIRGYPAHQDACIL